MDVRIVGLSLALSLYGCGGVDSGGRADERESSDPAHADDDDDDAREGDGRTRQDAGRGSDKDEDKNEDKNDDDDGEPNKADAGDAGSRDVELPDLGDAMVPDASSAAPADAGSSPPVVTAIDAPGPFTTQSPMGERAGPDCTIHRPRKLGEGGARHPVILWGMGTGGFNTYGPTFELWASHGFIVAGALLGQGQGDGVEMLACLDYVCREYAPHVDCERVGASGHSQGGAGAIMTGRDPRVITTAPIQPYTQQGFGGFATASIAQQQGPMLLLSGSADTIATPQQNQRPVFERINQPVVWATLNGADHVLTGIDGAEGYRSVALAWFRLQLMQDETLRSMFYGPTCTLCADRAWSVQRKGTD